MAVSRLKLLYQAIGRLLLQPQKITGSSEVKGDVVDAHLFQSATISIITGAVTGTPDSLTVTAKLYANTANSTSGGVDTGITFTGSPLTLADQILTASLDLGPFARYLYLGVTPTFVNGTSPGILIAATITLGDAKTVEPVS